MTKRLRRAFGGLLGEFLGLGASTVLDRGARLVTSLVAAALIGPADWGMWFVVNLVIVYGSLTHLGSPNGMNLEVPSALGRGDDTMARRFEGVSAAVLMGSILITWAVLGVIVVSGSWGVPASLLFTAGLLLTGNQAYTFVTMVLKARMRFPLLAKIQVVSAVTFPILVIPATYRWHLEGFIVAQALHFALLAVVVATAGGASFRLVLDAALAKRTISVGFPIMLVGVTFALFSTVDRWIIVAVLGTESLGYYSLAIMTLSAIALLPRVVSQQIYPRMAYAWSAGHKIEELTEMARLQRRTALMVALPVSVLLAAIGPWAVHTFLPAYAPGVPALLITLAIPILYSFGQGYGNMFNVLGMRSTYLWLIVAATAANGGASFVLVRGFGITGVAVGTLIGFAFLATALVVVGNRSLPRRAVGNDEA